MPHNIARMQQCMDALGLSLRPHVKTAKHVAVTRRQRDAGARGIMASTLKEAEQIFDAGLDDILYAVCVAPTKLPAARALRERGSRRVVVVYSETAAGALVGSGHAFEVMIEIDPDGHRASVLPGSDLLLEVGRPLHDGGALLRGVMTHAGASDECRTPQSLRAMAEQERSRCVMAGVGEGVAASGELGFSVLATRNGHQHDKGGVLAEAGWMAMSSDCGAQGQPVDWGDGAVCSEDGTLDDHLMSGAKQKHGIVSRHDGQMQSDRPHACP